MKVVDWVFANPLRGWVTSILVIALWALLMSIRPTQSRAQVEPESRATFELLQRITRAEERQASALESIARDMDRCR